MLVRVVTAVTSAITGDVVSVVVVCSSFSLQEKMMKLKSKREKMMRICLTWFPIGGYRRTQYIPRFGGVLQEIGEVSSENTKSTEHYTSYGYCFRIYGNFAEILK